MIWIYVTYVILRPELSGNKQCSCYMECVHIQPCMLEPESEEETDNEEDTDVHMQTCVCAFIELNDYGCMHIIFLAYLRVNSHDFHYNFRLMLFNNIHCKRVCFIILSSLEAGQSVAVNAN